MDSQRLEQLVARMRELDSQSVKFYDAKQTLASEGYSDEEIATATYTFPYDGKPNQPKPKDKVAEYIASHPEVADAIAGSVGEIERDKANYKQLAADSHELATRGMIAPGGVIIPVVNYTLARIAVVAGLLVTLLMQYIRPPSPALYMTEYLVCGLALVALFVMVLVRSLRMTKATLVFIGVVLVLVGALYMTAKRHEAAVTAPQCHSIGTSQFCRLGR